MEGLLAVRAVVDSLLLLRADDSTTDELLSSPHEVELLGLEGRPRWLGRADVPSGVYTGVRLRFRELVAIDLMGAAVDLNVTAEELIASFAVPTNVANGARLIIDFDVASSFQGDRNSSPLEFVPQGSVKQLGGTSASLAPFVVEYQSTANEELVVRAIDTGSGAVSKADIRIRFPVGSVRMTKDGTEATDTAEFVAPLIPGRSQLELFASLEADHRFAASRATVLVLDGEEADPAFEGLVLATDPELELLVQEADAAALDALDNELDPLRPQLATTQRTVFFDRRGAPTSQAELVVGQRLHVRFHRAGNSLEARSVTVVDEHDLEAHLAGSASLPSEITVHARADDLWVQTGRIDSAATDVAVDVRSAVFVLDGTDVELDPDEVAADGLLRITGALRGPSGSPTIDGDRVVLRAGAVAGCVVDADPGLEQFDLRVARLLAPFSDDPDVPALITVQFRDFTTTSGDATDARGFFALWSNLSADELLRVEVSGFLHPNGELMARTVHVEQAPRLRAGTELWPPNHRLVDIDLLCDLDPRDDLGRPLGQVEVTAVTQDEPVNGKGDGNTSPDATGIGAEVVSVRAERAGPGNGRVYRVHFRGVDPDGGTVEDSFSITVPHDQSGKSAIDDGQDYDSTESE